jgi:hypothetical protein
LRVLGCVDGLYVTGIKRRLAVPSIAVVERASHSANPAALPITCFVVRAIPCSALAQQRHKIISIRLALVGEESVSGVTRGSSRGSNQEGPLMRTYIIGNDGITLCREAPATVNEGEIAIA